MYIASFSSCFSYATTCEVGRRLRNSDRVITGSHRRAIIELLSLKSPCSRPANTTLIWPYPDSLLEKVGHQHETMACLPHPRPLPRSCVAVKHMSAAYKSPVKNSATLRPGSCPVSSFLFVLFHTQSVFIDVGERVSSSYITTQRPGSAVALGVQYNVLSPS